MKSIDLKPVEALSRAGEGKRVGLIADTHGLLRAQAGAALAGCDLIVHAGDIGGLEVLQELESVAPVLAVRGNVDVQPWASGCSYTCCTISNSSTSIPQQEGWRPW